mgnify:CR=1 FL=1
MLKILKKLIKSNSEYYKRYALVYRTSMYDDYKFMYCDEKELRRMLSNENMFSCHIFLTKDELEFETEIKMEE